MTDQSNMQKMHIPSDPGSNVQKMHIPQEWVEAGARAAGAANNDDPDFIGYQQDKPNWQLWSPCIEAALSAVIPLIREDERERLAKIAEESDTQFTAWVVRDWKPDADGNRPSPHNLPLAYWIRSEVEAATRQAMKKGEPAE